MTEGKKREEGKLSRSENRLIVHYDPRSPEAEAYRILRTNIEHANLPQGAARIMLVTSSRPTEGKTVTAANLAITIAEKGKNVLIVDTDMRRPAIHTIFGLDKYPGLSEILSEGTKWEKVLKPSIIENLSIITSGEIPPNPSELIGSSKMEKLIEELKGYFNTIILDCASVLAVTDATILGSSVDGVLMVIMAEKTPREAVQRAMVLLNNVKAPLIGVVLNNVEMRRHAYYYYYDYGSRK